MDRADILRRIAPECKKVFTMQTIGYIIENGKLHTDSPQGQPKVIPGRIAGAILPGSTAIH